MRGTTNTAANKIAGEVLKPATVNDLLSILTTADDDAAFDNLTIDGYSGVTSTTPRVGFVPLREGPPVVFAAGRNVAVNPMRVMRSTIDFAAPRAALSATLGAQTTIALPAAVAGGTWRLELLYAELTYVDAAAPAKGAALSLKFAPTGAGASTAGAPTIAALPANTSTVWNVPIAYVKNVGGAASVAQEDIMPYPAAVVSGFALPYHKRRGPDARRAYSSANNSPAAMVSGGASVLAGAADSRVTSTNTPIGVGRPEAEIVIREILLPKEITNGTAGVVTHVEVDDSRDWRGANFYTMWIVAESNAASYYFGEDDSGLGANRIFPHLGVAAGICGVHVLGGQSWNAIATNLEPAAGSFTVAELQTGTLANGGTHYFTLGSDFVGLTVHPSTGVLRFSRKIAGAIAGAPISVLVFASFGHHRP